MADGTNNMPDQSQALLALKQYTDQASAGKPPVILSLLPGGGRDINVGQGCSLQSAALIKFDGKAQFAATRKQTLMDKAGNAVRTSILEDCKKMVQGVAAIYSGEITTGAPVGSGNSFASSISAGPSGGGDIAMG